MTRPWTDGCRGVPGRSDVLVSSWSLLCWGNEETHCRRAGSMTGATANPKLIENRGRAAVLASGGGFTSSRRQDPGELGRAALGRVLLALRGGATLVARGLTGGRGGRPPAGNGADCAADDLRGFVVAQAHRAHEHQDLAMRRAQLPERARHIVEIQHDVLGGARHQCLVDDVVDRAAAEAVTPALVEEAVAEDGEHPCAEVCSLRELRARRPRPQKGVLHQIVRGVDVFDHTPPIGPYGGNPPPQPRPELPLRPHSRLPAGCRSLRTYAPLSDRHWPSRKFMRDKFKTRMSQTWRDPHLTV